MGNSWSGLVSWLYDEKDMREYLVPCRHSDIEVKFVALVALFPISQPDETVPGILVVGLDAAGKTTILHKLEIGEIITTIPTVGFSVETVEYKNLRLISWDFGGPEKNRPYWKSSYFPNTQGIIFVVDSNDRERVSQAREELQHMMNEDELQEAPFLIFANKHDLPNAMNEDEIADKLGLYDLTSGKLTSPDPHDGNNDVPDFITHLIAALSKGQSIVQVITNTIPKRLEAITD
ncbi:hypothetical protein FS837_004396 [Tulasnella sp. UAMH 9824]|nr:hypothetical protein FS837_004396 [Tulasnella sp. UAMH 9824]